MGILDLFSRLPSADELTGSFGEALVGFYSKHFTDALVLRDAIIDGAEGYTSYEKGYEDAFGESSRRARQGKTEGDIRFHLRTQFFIR